MFLEYFQNLEYLILYNQKCSKLGIYAHLYREEDTNKIIEVLAQSKFKDKEEYLLVSL